MSPSVAGIPLTVLLKSRAGKTGQKPGSFRSESHMVIKHHEKNSTKHALRDYAVCHIMVYYRA